jgi:hypothetical protein
MAKTHDRAQVLQVAAQFYPYFAEQAEVSIDGAGMESAGESSVTAAIFLIDEVDRQCPLPGKPEATLPPLPRQGRRITP